MSNTNKAAIPLGHPAGYPPLSRAARWAVLAAAFGGLLFDGIELGLMPVASLSVSRSLLQRAVHRHAGRRLVRTFHCQLDAWRGGGGHLCWAVWAIGSAAPERWA